MIDREQQIDELAKTAIYRAINGRRCLRSGHCKHCGAHKAATNPQYKKCDCYRMAEIVFEVVNGRPREGEWIVTKTEHGWNSCEYPSEYTCSVCGRTEPIPEPYCHCGAKMKGGAE